MNESGARAPAATWSRSPLFWAALCWMLGIVIGRATQIPLQNWATLAGLATVIAWLGIFIARKRGRGGGRWGAVILMAGLATVAASGAWWQFRTVERSGMFQGESRLIEIDGTVARDPRQRLEAAGELGRFDYRGPGSTFWVWIDTINTESEGLAAPDPDTPLPLGRVALLVSVPDYEDRLRAGDRVRLRGWLSGIRQPGNPGERDFQRTMGERAVVGRLSVGSRSNIQILETLEENPTSLTTLWPRMLERSRATAQHALRLGLPLELATPDARTITGDAEAMREAAGVIGVLEALLLGKRGDMEELEELFARTGLTHLLAISGLHLGILVLGATWITLIVTGRPRLAVGVAMAVVAVYVLMVPPRVPVVRAAVMTLAAVWSLGCGRRISAMATMSGAALLLLIWRPWDLFTAGFQLSFAVVVALVLFARTAATWMNRPDALDLAQGSAGLWRRVTVDYLAVSVVAWCTAMPLVAWHFGRVSPLAVFSAIAMLPFVAGILWVGYLKIIVGVLLPPVGTWLGPPLWLLAELTVNVVQMTAALPGATLEVGSVSGWWTLCTLGFLGATLSGAFAGRRLALTLGIALLVGWLAAGPPVATILDGNGLPRRWARVPGLAVNVFSVGHGSAILLRSGDATWMYDCGSAEYFDITTASVGPALDAVGVRSIDTVVLSHPDIDHFSGMLELVDRYNVQRVIVAEQLIADAEASAWSASRYLLDKLRDRDVRIEQVNADHSETFGEAQIDFLWPPVHESFERNNDASLVLRITTAGRTVLLTGDIESVAMEAMLESGMIDGSDGRWADVVELPHHGAWTEAGPRWMQAVDPLIVFQSTNDRRMALDRWGPHLEGIERHVTAQNGMISVHIDREGRIHRERFHE